MLGAIVAPLVQAHEDKKRQERTREREQFRELLTEQNMNSHSVWSEV